MGRRHNTTYYTECILPMHLWLSTTKYIPITTSLAEIGEGPGPPLFFGGIWTPRERVPLLYQALDEQRPHFFLRIWVHRNSYGNLIVLALATNFKNWIRIYNFFHFLELSFPYSYYNSQFNFNVFWFWHSVSFLKFLGDFTGIYIRIWRSTWKKWSYTREKST